jgi:hypothetical protein
MEEIIMDPNFTIMPMQPIMTSQPYTNSIYFTSIFTSKDEEEDFLASLDSDTRDYVLKHTDDFRTKEEMLDCIRDLHSPD